MCLCCDYYSIIKFYFLSITFFCCVKPQENLGGIYFFKFEFKFRVKNVLGSIYYAYVYFSY